MVCKNCGSPLVDGAKFCTKCGQRVEEVVAEVKEVAAETQEQVEEATTEVKEIVAEAQETVAEAQEEAKEDVNEAKENVADVTEGVKETVAEVATEVKETVEGAKEKVKKFPKGALIAIVAIVVVLIFVLANFKTVANSVNKLVSSEEKYYASVEKGEIKELASSVADIYENSFLEYYNDYNDTSIDYGMEVELSEQAYDMVAAAIGAEDGKPFSKMAVDLFVSLKGDVISAELAATLGKTQLISADGVMDVQKGQMFGRVDELTSKYIGIDFAEYAEMVSESMDQADEFIDILPSKKTVESLVNRYMTIVVENLDDVTEKKDTVSVGDIEQNCTAIRVRIREKDMNKITVAVLEEAKDDKELISLLTDYAVAEAKMQGAEEEVDAKEYEEMIKAEIEAALEEAKDAEVDTESEEELIMNVWVNNKGEVIGREIEVEEETVFVYKMPEKGGKFAFEASISDGYDGVVFEGEGKKSSSSLSGDFAVKMKTQKYDWDTDSYKDKTTKYLEVTVDKFDTKKIKEGFLNGTFTLELSDELIQEADLGMAGVMFGDYNIKCDFKSSKNNASAEIALMDRDDMFAKVILDAKIGSGKSASLPKGVLVEGEEDVIEWAKTIKFDKFIKNLKKAGLPVEIVEEIEDVCENIEDMLSRYE